MKKILETERLYLREMTSDDFDNLCLILKDKEVMYAYEHAFDDYEVKAWLEKQLLRYQNDKIGLWAVILKETNEMIGQCGLTYQDTGSETVLEIGYLFRKAFWHRGYASEAAKACRKYAFDTLNAKRVYSIIRDSNKASQNVAKRNGMTAEKIIVKNYYNIDMPHILYSISCEEYDEINKSDGL